MFCSECGKEIPAGSHFCINCGAPKEAVGTQAPPGATPAAPPPAVTPPPPATPPSAPPPPATPPPIVAPMAAPMAAIPAAPGQKNTLKWAIIGVVSLLVVAAIVLVVVFVALGSDTGKAKELARKGDVYMNKATATGKNVATSVNDLMTNFKTVSSASDYESMADSIRTDTKSATSDLGSAQKEYKQILDLSGVDKYKDYARARLAQIDVDFKQVRAVDDYLDYLSRQFSDAEAGATIDSAAIAVTTATFFSGLEEASTEAGKLKDKADNLQKDLQL